MFDVQNVAFKAHRAIKAGLVFISLPKGTEEEIWDAVEQGNDYLANLLAQKRLVVKVPGDMCLTGVTEVQDMLLARFRNKLEYKQLTDWLFENDIPWSQF